MAIQLSVPRSEEDSFKLYEALVSYKEGPTLQQYKWLKPNWLVFQRKINLIIENTNSTICISKLNNQVTGVMIASVGAFLFSDDKVVAVQCFVIFPQYRHTSSSIKLISFLRKWSKRHKAKEIFISVSSGEKQESVSKANVFFEKLGFSYRGNGYSLEL